MKIVEKIKKLFGYVPEHFRKKRVILGFAIIILAVLKSLNIPIVDDVYYEVVDKIIEVLTAIGFVV
ncbi:hypothetical protein [Thermoactinomyces vulgaris]|jgi:hypothetical protein|uniref:hypothetical protein n=1 Tax=Thermoactinomyces vulgaris TaxID=2026 RepID=UPI003635D091